MNNSTSVFLVDDHTLLLESLAQRLDGEPDIHVAGSARRAEDALRQIRDLHPPADIVLMDIDLPDMSGFDAAARLMRRQPDARIIFLSAFWHDGYIEQAIRVKASGYLTKLESSAAMVEAIRRVAAGDSVYSDEVRQRLEFGAESARRGGSGRTPLAALTAREQEILARLADGMHKPQIAAALHISVKTVAAHTTNIMRKLGIHDRVELTRYAIREGLVRP